MAPTMTATVHGLDDVVAQLAKTQRGAELLGKTTGYVYSSIPYAWGIEEGTHRNGRLARRAGGAHYMSSAIATVLAGADTDLGEGLTKVNAPGPWVIRRLARWARRLARQNAPVSHAEKTIPFRLRQSLRYAIVIKE